MTADELASVTLEQHASMDQLSARVERIERRFELSDPPH